MNLCKPDHGFIQLGYEGTERPGDFQPSSSLICLFILKDTEQGGGGRQCAMHQPEQVSVY